MSESVVVNYVFSSVEDYDSYFRVTMASIGISVVIHKDQYQVWWIICVHEQKWECVPTWMLYNELLNVEKAQSFVHAVG